MAAPVLIANAGSAFGNPVSLNPGAASVIIGGYRDGSSNLHTATATWNGAAMTTIGYSFGSLARQVALYRSATPGAGAQDFLVTVDGNFRGGFAASFSGTHATTPFGNSTEAHDETTTVTNFSVTSSQAITADDIFIGMLGTASNIAFTAGSGIATAVEYGVPDLRVYLLVGAAGANTLQGTFASAADYHFMGIRLIGTSAGGGGSSLLPLLRQLRGGSLQ